MEAPYKLSELAVFEAVRSGMNQKPAENQEENSAESKQDQPGAQKHQPQTLCKSVMRPIGNHSATRMFPSRRKMAACGVMNCPGVNSLLVCFRREPTSPFAVLPSPNWAITLYSRSKMQTWLSRSGQAIDSP